MVWGPHGVLQIGHYADTPSAGVLVGGDYATVFHSRSAARAAITRSENYCVKEGFDWAVWKWKIYRLKVQGTKKFFWTGRLKNNVLFKLSEAA